MTIQDVEKYANLLIEKVVAYLPSVIGAILAIVIGLWLIKFITKKIRNIMEKRDVDIAIRNFSLSIINIGLKILLFIIVITKLGFETTSFAAIIGAAGLAVGLALQGSLSNFAGGVLIILLKPFRIGDWVDAQGVSGTVDQISLFYTHLITFNNQRAVIPNGELSNNKVINYSSEKQRKDAITVRISYDSDIKKAREVLMDLMLNNENISKETKPQVFVSELAESSVNLSIRFWADLPVFWDAHFQIMADIKGTLEEAGIRIPLPQRHVMIHNQEDTDSDK
ncbi:MAG: mechanosensitive ion channel family protein [Psychroflexus halocasei]|uniref:mechanosensitive ion channel family protein n=1 Tax=Psychroflexus sp. S27 TaxID=1982757 RepID=UPI000C29BF7B|nr:mechanosensitive ion channel domain-containing protein [Psychroflexus sp. S27]MDN6280830.1 mechanosensitive ion channel [Psychroflexus sp.]PJX21548.1 mechanosensitive ion channel protein MscS [Psychroflexus sp. S27]